jgi:nitroimidazol reductase NimA-like FMN-containing flavoprotein (pyridoxamine 5'-phosphate oxidase superfamily)
MPRSPLPDELKAFLAEPNPSVIATLTADGKPHSAATWYLWDDGRVLVNMAATRKRLANMRRDPNVSLTVVGSHECTAR